MRLRLSTPGVASAQLLLVTAQKTRLLTGGDQAAAWFAVVRIPTVRCWSPNQLADHDTSACLAEKSFVNEGVAANLLVQGQILACRSEAILVHIDGHFPRCSPAR